MKKSWLMKNGKRYDTHEAYDARSESEGNSDESCKGVIPTFNRVLEKNIEMMVWLKCQFGLVNSSVSLKTLVTYYNCMVHVQVLDRGAALQICKVTEYVELAIVGS
jgi:hypothetical protein